MRVLGALGLLIALGLVLVLGAMMYMRTPGGTNLNTAKGAAEKAAGAATKHVNDVVKNLGR